jgi:hypothetical protein
MRKRICQGGEETNKIYKITRGCGGEKPTRSGEAGREGLCACLVYEILCAAGAAQSHLPSQSLDLT